MRTGGVLGLGPSPPSLNNLVLDGSGRWFNGSDDVPPRAGGENVESVGRGMAGDVTPAADEDDGEGVLSQISKLTCVR